MKTVYLKARPFLALAALLTVGTAVHAETDPYAPYPISVKKSGPNKEKAYLDARKEVLDNCDRDRGYIESLNVQFLEGWGAAHGVHFIIADATCRVHRS
jgi:hypothetical protein